ncbi:ankyrin repeat and LEM domain-containing protein 1-like [Dysidea avara]|uniref:ankyrin repeat and LEM domain-containing protein 1-like n=1 Tax=Dysidea avara TaxID=196820 RepID=UPI003319EF96
MDGNLVAAVTDEDYTTIKRLLSSQQKLTAMEPSGVHILHIAANSDNEDIISLLASQWPAHVNTASDDGTTPLHVASTYGQLNAVKALVENGADPFAVDQEGMTPLDCSMREGQVQCIQYYKELGIRPDCDEEEGEDSMALAYTTMLMESTFVDYHEDDTTMCSIEETTILQDSTMLEETFDLTDVQQFSNSMLRRKLQEMGEKPGPVNDLTRHAYLRYLHKLQTGLLSPQKQQEKNSYKYELALCLSGALPLPDHTHYQQIEKKLFSDLNVESATKRSTRNCFNYLLIDPRISRLISTTVGDLDKFRLFVEAIFYIGKGQKDRPLQHLVDAKESQVNAPNKARSSKLQRILDIWKQGNGVVSLHCFHSALAAEAFTREACMVEAVGLPNLTNIKRGQYYGICTSWPIQKKRQLGVYLLHKAYHMFLVEGEQQIFPYNL